MCVCVCGGGGGGKGTGEVIHLFQTLCVWGGGGVRGRWVEVDGEGDSLISNYIEII